MQAFGVYFDIIEASKTPVGPFGLSLLIWGIILFDIFAISVIVQLWWHIHKLEKAKPVLLNKTELIKSIYRTMDTSIDYIRKVVLTKEFEKENPYITSTELSDNLQEAYNACKREKNILEQEISVAGSPISQILVPFKIFVNINTPSYYTYNSEFGSDYEEICSGIRKMADSVIKKIHSTVQ